jgi:aminopeptidase N
MAHLRATLGNAAFWLGSRRYTRANAGGIVKSIDPERSMESDSHSDLSPLFAEWVFGTGYEASQLPTQFGH